VWDLLPTDARSAIFVAERFADGDASETDRQAAAIRPSNHPVTPSQHAVAAAARATVSHEALPPPRAVLEPRGTGIRLHDAAIAAARAAAARAAGPATSIRPTEPVWHAAWHAGFRAARAEQADLVRDIFPPPGTSPAVEPEWLTSTVVALARQMYESREFSAMPILADALQDAGCADELVLGHCRKPAPHVRGCWVVDLILGK
jgi:hypothetical protein